MVKADIDNLPNYAGIYLIRNTVNNKCYVGQAIKLRTRLRNHWFNWVNDRYSHIILYKAFKKYGIDKFELTVLESFRNALDWRVSSRLNELEKNYIQQYDSYANGYNQTLGGEGEVLGYKHSKETKEILSKKAKEISDKKKQDLAKDTKNWIKCKNLETEDIYIFTLPSEAVDELGLNRIVVYNCLHKRQSVAYKKWQICYYNEEFEELPKFNSDDFKFLIQAQFKRLSNKDEICKYILENPKCTYSQIKQDFELSKRTFYNYKKELGVDFDLRVDTIVTKEEFISYYNNHSKTECINHFNIPERLYYKYIKKYINTNE